MKTKYTAEYFINKFKVIPLTKWTTGQYKKGDRYCALGHCGLNDTIPSSDESLALENLFLEHYITVDGVNDDNCHHGFKGKHPRTRILNALKTMR